MTEFEETSKKIRDLVDEVFKQGVGVGYDHGLEVGTQNGYKRGYERGYEADKTDVYDQGYEDGKKSIEECAEKITYKDINDAYQRGLDDAWECARKIYNMTASEVITAFGGCSNWVDYSASEAIAKVREYKQDKPKNTLDDLWKNIKKWEKEAEQDKDYHEEAWWQNLGYDIEQMADDWGCTIECIAERANQLWEEKGEQNDK